MGCVEAADITDEEIIAAKEDHERVQKLREKQKTKSSKRFELGSRFSKTAKSYNITATPSMIDGHEDLPNQITFGTTLSVENAQKREAVITANSNILCVIYSFDKLLAIATFDPVLEATDMTTNEVLRYFGGETRTQRLIEHFSAIRAEMEYEINNETTIRTKEIFVVSDTLKTIQIRTLLEKVGLLDKVVPITTTAIAGDANSGKDFIIGTDHRFMSDGASKNMAVFKILQEKKYAHDQILYIDNVKAIVEYFNSISLCRTFLVKDEYGISPDTCFTVESMFDKNNATTEFTLEPPSKPLDLHIDDGN
ncbi:hypothetical protein RFI_23665 [Reticulomyxa filosa]|uniref:Uncharacterized protein n=1 Tax=Reticulomyxa filosa TaxID=46433 RepID=X6MKU9_RETFI|nr:hypothetical protein RFI_23665 [Reticulomyxa filosa]|eukprot:ETO13705.1 hypothetical protein RFI_23665 [Reticulomyxa filosa]